MVRSWADQGTKDIWDGRNTKSARAIPRTLWTGLVERLEQLDAATALGDLRVPPSNRLERLRGDRRGTYSIRVNRQYRITFRFSDGDAYRVCCEDYHQKKRKTPMPKKHAKGDIPATGLPTHRPPTHPGTILRHRFLEEMDMTQAEAARRMDIPVTRVNELVRGKRGITARSALRLSRLLGTTPQFWMNLQAGWDLWHALQEEKKLGRAS